MTPCHGYSPDERCPSCDDGNHASCLILGVKTFTHIGQRPCDGHICACPVCAD